MKDETLKALARALQQAELERQPIDPLTDAHPDLTVEDAYAIQKEVVRQKTRQGSKVRGRKVGFTAPAVQQMLGMNEPGYGYLLDSGAAGAGERISFDRLLQPKLEAEIAFVLKDRLRGPGLTIPDVLSAVDYLVPAFEIIDSRIRDWRIKAADTIADNASHGMFVLGDTRLAVNELDLPSAQMKLEKNGEVVATGTGKAVLGNPVLAVVWLANKLSETGGQLEAGEVILSGALATPLVLSKGDAVRANFGALGSVAISFS